MYLENLRITVFLSFPVGAHFVYLNTFQKFYYNQAMGIATILAVIIFSFSLRIIEWAVSGLEWYYSYAFSKSQISIFYKIPYFKWKIQK